MKFIENNLKEFTDTAFSKSAAPGGGGVSAMVGALGVALGGMVCNLTIGKKKYAEYEEDINVIVKKLEVIKEDLLSQIDKDAENFLPLAKAYSLPTQTEDERVHKDEVIQQATRVAMQAPVDIIRLSYDAIMLLDDLIIKGSTLAVSDVGCAATFLDGAIRGAYLNVVINLNLITDKEYTVKLKNELETLVVDGTKECRKLYEKVLSRLEN